VAHIFIGIGSSLEREKNIVQGVLALKTCFSQVRLSSVFESEAVGFVGGHFYNLVVECHSDMPIAQLIQQLKKIEIALGRKQNAPKNAPRGLDLDLLLYGESIDQVLNIPRAEIIDNAFVLQPLAELAPELLHPILKQSYQTLWQQYPKNKQKLWKIEMLFSE
jgi:2-amino-4-hydroxy-6-hydroxymethyldihydropteridine diphosphokinase